MNKKSPSWLQLRIEEYCYKMRISKSLLAKKIGFKRQQISNTMAGSVPCSKGFAKALGKELSIETEIILLSDGHLPEDILIFCRTHPIQIMDTLKSFCESLKDSPES